ncbi:hypothetical protein GCM10012275_20390 [Longimycelium tulufanense]|uniref:N-acetyltransferase domain-containing protein n=1 Tax=Longimycelium tulufanense TaxID=907463 RepID=A0A8J3FTG4_9PSEU|nr:GNAT family N-acetyltransferase [Longimycelium tulufanense]GGM49423.1 hypothetical protein GCM10012275_20390 [Longimycelium tulufanense]
MIVESASSHDIDELIRLYRAVYGPHYPLPLGTDPVVMAKFINNPDVRWLVARRPQDRSLVGSAVLEIDPQRRIAKIEGVVVHPDHRSGKVAQHLVAGLSDFALSPGGPVDSVYATARTVSPAPQIMFLRNGYLPLGIFPHARKLQRYETLVLLARFADGVLSRRHSHGPLPEALGSLLSAAERAAGLSFYPAEVVDTPPQPTVASRPMDWELASITGIADGEVRYPFHSPNLLAQAIDGSVTVRANLGENDGYCALLDANPGLTALNAHLESLVDVLSRQGVRYLEALLPLDRPADIDALLGQGFLPTALYPAMRREGELFRDHVVLSRLLQPLDFRELVVARPFGPFVSHYLDLWTATYLAPLRVAS